MAGTFALIPMKRFDQAKSRLRGQLSDGARDALARSMFARVLAAADGCRAIDRIAVLTNGDEVARLAIDAGAHVLSDPNPPLSSLGALIDRAWTQLPALGAERAVVLMADLPYLDANDVGALAAALDGCDLALVKDRRGHSTNALALRLPARFASAFGQAESYRLHLARATEHGLVVAQLDQPRIAHDVDLPEDLPDPSARGDAFATGRAAPPAKLGSMKQCPKCGVRFYERSTLCPIDATVLVELPDPLIGRVIQERYQVEELLGSGGMGSVYRGRHQVINRSVALKFLAPKHARDESSRQRFLREARAVNRVQHEHIIDVSDFGETEDGLVYMVMEFLAGRTLADDIAAGPMALTRACDIGLQLSLALARAHELGVVHRDVKPANVFLLRKNNHSDFVKLLDFGLARAQDDVALTKSNLLFGTPEYMAPEQASSGPVGAKADLYAFGCVLFEMTTGRLPFEGAPTGLIYKHVYEPPPRPKKLRPELPTSLETLVLRLLHKDPERRPASAYEVADELTRIAQSLPQPSQNVSAGPSSRASGEMSASEVRNEEDRWQNNLLALHTRITDRYRDTDPPQAVKVAMQRMEQLVSDAQTLRKQLGAITMSTVARHDAARATQLRIGTAIDTLALDESRTAQELEAIGATVKTQTEQVELAARQLLAARTSLAEGATPLDHARGLALLETWAEAQQALFALQDRLTEKEVARADLRFQISHLKGRLAGMDAAETADLEPTEARASQLQAELTAALSAIRGETERVTSELGPQLRSQ